MFKVQRHFENDNGKDIVWLFENEQNAVGFYWDLVDGYEKVCSVPPQTEDYKVGFKRYLTATFKNADESYTQYSLEEIETEG